MSNDKWHPFEAVVSGETADIYFVRTKAILEAEGANPTVVMEVFSKGEGILCGIEEAKALLKAVLPPRAEVYGLNEGEAFHPREVVLRIRAPYQSFAVYETAYLGILSHCSGWATAARECVEAAQGKPVISFGARHVHPNVAAIMDYAAIVGGCATCSSVAGARLAGTTAAGTMPHALILALGDTVAAAEAFDRHMPPEAPRIVLVDTYKDEVEESLRVARALGPRLAGVRLDTPAERGRVTPDLAKEVRAWLDQEGFPHVTIFVSGGVNPARIAEFIRDGAPVDAFGVGGYITDASPIDFTADIHEVEGRPVAKRGRLPGLTPSPRLRRLI